ncbi:MAG TPA: metal-dependent hydrolase [Polyangiaceae bacterium]
MDNITHSLAGIWLAEAALPAAGRSGEGRTSSLRSALYFAAILGNNLPDADGLYAGRLAARPLGYLLHHRGHSHTVALALPLALLTFALTLGFLRLRRQQLERRDVARLALVALLGPLLHISFDFANNYGVHPFWPLYDGWLYGDSFFIVEPLFWAALIPLLLLQARTLLARGLLGFVLVFGLCLCTFSELVPARMAVLVFAYAALSAALAWRVRPAARVWLAAALFALPALSFAGMHRLARAHVLELAARQFPRETTLDVVTTPTPANPLCWNITLVSRDGRDYVVRSGTFSTWPGVFTASACHYEADEHPTAPHTRVTVAVRPELRWSREFRAAGGELRALAADDCRVAAFLGFARAPYWTPAGDGPQIVGDVRYDREAAIEFAEFALTPNPQCPRHVPPWIPPRSDVLDATVESSR